MKPKDLIIFGAGKTADVIFRYIQRDLDVKIAGFTCDQKFISDSYFNGLPVYPFESLENTLAPESHQMIIAMGYHDLNSIRAKRYQDAKNKGYELMSYISPKSSITEDVILGENCIIMDNASVQPGTRIGSNVAIWNNTVVGHHSIIGNHCWLASHTSIAGSTNIGDYCFLGMNATIGHELSIGPRCFIGAGSLLTKNADSNGVYIKSDTPRFRLDIDHFLKMTKMK